MVGILTGECYHCDHLFMAWFSKLGIHCSSWILLVLQQKCFVRLMRSFFSLGLSNLMIFSFLMKLNFQ